MIFEYFCSKNRAFLMKNSYFLAVFAISVGIHDGILPVKREVSGALGPHHSHGSKLQLSRPQLSLLLVSVLHSIFLPARCSAQTGRKTEKSLKRLLAHNLLYGALLWSGCWSVGCRLLSGRGWSLSSFLSAPFALSLGPFRSNPVNTA